MKGVKIMMEKFFTRFIMVIAVLSAIACGGLQFSQLDPAAKNYHPKRIAVFPADAGAYEEARNPVEQVVSDVLKDKGWFTNVTDAASLRLQIQSNEVLSKTMTDYMSKLQTLNYSDSALTQKIGEQAQADAFLLVTVDYWNYAVEKEKKLAKVSLGLKLIDAETGKIMWKARHNLSESYMLLKPELSKVARSVINDMLKEMPH